MPAPVKPPIALRDLPRDRRGYIVPAEATWNGDVPDLGRNRPETNFCLAATGSCVVCGLQNVDELVWRIFNEDDLQNAERELSVQGAFSERMYGGHKSCMLYSALVCPYWATENARLTKDSQWAPGAKRGKQCALIGVTNVDILFDSSGRLELAETMFLYTEPGVVIRFSEPETELLPIYEQAIRDEKARSLNKRVYFGPDHGGERRLTRLVSRAVAALKEDSSARLPDIRFRFEEVVASKARFRTPWI